MRILNRLAVPLASFVMLLALACQPPAPAPTPESNGGAAATAPSAHNEQATRGGTLSIALTHDVDSLNPLTSGSYYATQVEQKIFMVLAWWEIDPDTGRAVLNPDRENQLSSGWEFGDGDKTLTFFLKKGIRWHDGEEVTSADVKYTFETAMDPEVQYQNVGDLDMVERIETPDDYTVKFIFKQAYANALADVADAPMIVPEHILSRYAPSEIKDCPFTKQPVGCGPFMLKSWKPKQEVVLQRNPDYFVEGVPYLDVVTFKIIPEFNSAMQGLKAREFHMLEVVPEHAAETRGVDHVRLRIVPGRSYRYIGWNLNRPLFQDVRVRRALTMGLDRESFTGTVLHGYGEVAIGPMLRFHEGYDLDSRPLPYDPEQAGQLLDEAGWTMSRDGWRYRDGTRLEFKLTTRSSDGPYRQIATAAADQLKKIGVRVDVELMEWAAMLEKIEDKDFEGCLLGWSMPFVFNPRDIWSGEGKDKEDSYNFVSYDNARVNELIRLVRLELDPGVREGYWKEFQQIIEREQPYTFLYVSDDLWVIDNKFRDAVMDARGPIEELEYWYIAG